MTITEAPAQPATTEAPSTDVAPTQPPQVNRAAVSGKLTAGAVAYGPGAEGGTEQSRFSMAALEALMMLWPSYALTQLMRSWRARPRAVKREPFPAMQEVRQLTDDIYHDAAPAISN